MRPVRAAVTRSFSFTVARAPHPLALDASLADPAWAAGKVPNGNGPWENVTTRAPAKFATTAYLLYDDKNLYVGFKAEQAGVPIVATQTTNDVGFGTDDFVGIGLLNGGGGSQAYYFEATPRGIALRAGQRKRALSPALERRRESLRRNVERRPDHSARRLARAARRQANVAAAVRPPDRGAAASTSSGSWNPIMGDAPSGTWPIVPKRYALLGRRRLRHRRFGRGSARSRAPTSTAWPASARIAISFSKPTASFCPRTCARSAATSATRSRRRSVSSERSIRIFPTSRSISRRSRRKSSSGSFSSTGRSSHRARPSSTPPPGRARRRGTNVNAPDLAFYSPSVGPFDSGGKVEGTFGDQSFGVLTFHGYRRNDEQHV